MPMSFSSAEKVVTLQGDSVLVATGPDAAMVPIKELGSNGGGYFGTNDAHPFESPDFFSYNPTLTSMGIDNSAGNMEGKETRNGSYYSAVYAGKNASVPAGTIMACMIVLCRFPV